MTYRNSCKPMLRRKMQARIALVLKVWILDVSAIVAHDALHEVKVVEKDSTAQTPRYVNPTPHELACSLQYSSLPVEAWGHTCRQMRSMIDSAEKGGVSLL